MTRISSTLVPYQIIVRTFFVVMCVALSACATTGRQLAELPEPVTSLHIAANETPLMTGSRGTDGIASAQMSIYMKFIEREIAATFDISNVQVSTGPLRAPIQTNARYVLFLNPSSARKSIGIQLIHVDAVLVHAASRKPVWSYVLEVDGNAQRFSRASVQALADEMLAQRIIQPASVPLGKSVQP